MTKNKSISFRPMTDQSQGRDDLIFIAYKTYVTNELRIKMYVCLWLQLRIRIHTQELVTVNVV